MDCAATDVHYCILENTTELDLFNIANGQTVIVFVLTNSVGQSNGASLSFASDLKIMWEDGYAPTASTQAGEGTYITFTKFNDQIFARYDEYVATV